MSAVGPIEAPGPRLPHRERPRRDAASTAAWLAVSLVGGGSVWVLLPVFIPDIATGARLGLAVLAAFTAVLSDPRPRIEVDRDLVRAAWRRIPIADIHRVRPDRRPQRLEADATPGSRVRWRVGTLLAREGVRIDAVTPEGLPYEVWIGSDDPGALVAAVEQARDATVESAGPAGTAAGYRGPRGAIWGLAVPFLAVGLAVTWVVATAVPLGGRLVATALLVAAVAVPASRSVEVGERRIVSGPVDVPVGQLVAARSAARGELPPHWQQLPRRNRAMTVWGPSHVLVLVTDPPGTTAQERLAATHLVALPRPVELSAVLPTEVVGRRLPPVEDAELD